MTSTPGNGIVAASALSATNMWAIGSATAPEDSIVHYTGTWQTVRAKALSGLQFSSIAAVSKHDVWAAWMTAENSAGMWALHRLTTASWSRIRIGSTAALFRIALIPGTTSLWGAGSVRSKSVANAAVWAHGRVG